MEDKLGLAEIIKLQKEFNLSSITFALVEPDYKTLTIKMVQITIRKGNYRHIREITVHEIDRFNDVDWLKEIISDMMFSMVADTIKELDRG